MKKVSALFIGSLMVLFMVSCNEKSLQTNLFINEANQYEREMTTQETSTLKENNKYRINIIINNKIFTATLYDNQTTQNLLTMLPLSMNMKELNGNEKYFYLPKSITTDATNPSNINTGDIMLYGSDCLVLFYENHTTSYTYTPIGKIDNYLELYEIIGDNDVLVTFELEE